MRYPPHHSSVGVPERQLVGGLFKSGIQSGMTDVHCIMQKLLTIASPPEVVISALVVGIM